MIDLIRGPLAIAAALLIAACDQSDAPGKDGYKFERSEFVRQEPVVRFVFHPSTADLQKAARAAGVADAHTTAAWSTLTPNNPGAPCTIHIVDPARRYQPQWIGHEIMHCIYGRWHR